MMLASLVASARDRWEKRRLFRRLVAEISNLTDQEIAEMGGNRGQMLRQTRWQVYGTRYY